MTDQSRPAATGLPEAVRVERLQPPSGRVRVVIDTDAANEIDDQFALAYAALSPERLALEAVYAAPFQRAAPAGADPSQPWFAATPAAGMARSRAEIVRVAEALGGRWPNAGILAGSQSWLPPDEPVPSPAATDLIRRARHGVDPLYVAVLGGPTNVASALRSAPDIVEDLVVVWLGGNGSWWAPAAAHNLAQDPAASRVLLDCGVPLVHVPCLQVTELLATTHEEIERRVRGRGSIGDYLAGIYRSFDHSSARMKPLWDLGPIAWLAHPQWCPSVLVPTPALHGTDAAELAWRHDPARHLMREVRSVDADAILEDLFGRLPPPDQP